MTVAPLIILAAGSTALAMGMMVWSLARPARPLRHRLRPYLVPTLSHRSASSPVSQVFGPLISAAASRLGAWLDRSGSEVTATRIRQAGWYRGSDGPDVVHFYRLTQLRSVASGMIIGTIIGWALNMSVTGVLALAGLGTTVGITRLRGRLERAIEDRREVMRIEIYTVNQLLAMRVRAGGGVVQAIQGTVARGRGEVVSELGDALRLHRAGWGAGEALRRIAELTPEPFCGRTYRLMASAEERGADLAGALLDLAEDVRESRRESIRRSATKRRAAMLVPTIAVLAPVLILFVAAPLPYLITGWN
jgi:tight adherence protein C